MLTGYGRGRTRQFMVSRHLGRSSPTSGSRAAGLADFFVLSRGATKASLAAWLGLGAACKILPRRPVLSIFRRRLLWLLPLLRFFTRPDK